MATPKLEAPPITEVACGIFFPPVQGLDPVFVGGWWRDIKGEYPKHEIKPAVAEGLGFVIGPGPLRSWLISEDEEWVVQVQPDRFYVNWRRRKGTYPRFTGSGGVGERALSEFKRFRAHCRQELGQDLAPSTAELAKVDSIIQGTHWNDPQDLGKVLPIVADVARFTKSGAFEFGLNLVEPRPNGTTQVTLTLSTEALFGGQLARAVRIDTRCVRKLGGPSDEAVSKTLAELNDDANDVFFGLINPDERARFRKTEAP